MILELSMVIWKRPVNIILLILVYSLVIGVTGISFLAKDEGTLGNNIILNFLADYLSFIALPAFYFALILAKTGLGNTPIFIIAVVSNGTIYTLLTYLFRRIYGHADISDNK